MQSPVRRRPALLAIALCVSVLSLVPGGCVTESGTGGAPGDHPPESPVVAPEELPRIPELPGRAPRYPRLLPDPEPRPEQSPGRTPPRGTQRRGNPPRPSTDPQIESFLDSLSLRQRIGQRFIAHVPGTHITHGAGSDIVDVAPAGFIIYPWNFRTADDVRLLTDSLQFITSIVTPGISLLLCADQEGGRVATFRFPEFVRLPSAAALGRLADPALIRSAAYVTARQLADLGVNMNLAPVLDLSAHADASIIGDRSYGPDPDTVSAMVRPYLEASRAAGVISAAKHFPGHGVTRVDSHTELPVVATTRSELEARDLRPFGEAIAAGVPAIMTGHLLFKAIDPFYPVTISRIFLHDLLRGELGYTGVVMTDGLEMAAIRAHFDLRETLVRLFRYDVDLILLYEEYDVVEMVDLVLDLHAAGEITEDDINRGVRRVLALKREYGLVEGVAP